MVEEVLYYFGQVGYWAIAISILLNIVIAVLGVVPSIFLTTANLVFFGFWKGTLISFLGEAIGAWVAFYLYRKGLKKYREKQKVKQRLLRRLVNAKGFEAFTIVFSLRLLPFIPSGIVTFIAAIGKVSPIVFILASSIGKAPALLIEAISVYHIFQFSWPGKLILVLTGVILLIMSLNRRKIKHKRTAE